MIFLTKAYLQDALIGAIVFDEARNKIVWSFTKQIPATLETHIIRNAHIVNSIETLKQLFCKWRLDKNTYVEFSDPIPVKNKTNLPQILQEYIPDNV